jgi:hypothetical protein
VILVFRIILVLTCAIETLKQRRELPPLLG